MPGKGLDKHLTPRGDSKTLWNWANPTKKWGMKQQILFAPSGRSVCARVSKPGELSAVSEERPWIKLGIPTNSGVSSPTFSPSHQAKSIPIPTILLPKREPSTGQGTP